MMRKPALCLIVLLLLSLAFTGCSGNLPENLSRDLMAGVQAAEWPDSPALPDASVRLASNRFAADLLMQAAKEEGNVFLSPFSVYVALAMTMNGANAATRDAMLDVLAAPGITVDQINEAGRSWLSLLPADTGKTSLVLANSIWFDSRFTPETPFLQTNADFFAAGARQIDFAEAASPGVISEWVEKQTNGRINNMIDSIDSNTVMFLINTIYFKSEWQKPFDEKKTVVLPFQTSAGPVDASMMTRTGEMAALSVAGADGVVIPYEDPRFAFFALLPSEMSPRDFLAQQDPGMLIEELSAQASDPVSKTVSLYLPQFEVRQENSLIDELTAMGMGITFMQGVADFSGINQDMGAELFIGEIKHKTFIRVDELGTEAAASTAVEIDFKSMPQIDLTLKLDRPFLFGIIDLQTRAPLFLGILDNPALP